MMSVTHNNEIHEFVKDDRTFIWGDTWMRVFEDATQIMGAFHEKFSSDEQVYRRFLAKEDREDAENICA